MVLARQIYASGQNVPLRKEGETLEHLVDRLRAFLFGDRANALDHDPALVNRMRRSSHKMVRGKMRKITIYSPDANDPKHLLYREAGPGSDHDIKTRVRGDGAQRSDLGQRRYNKRVARNRERCPPGKASRFPKRAAQVKQGTGFRSSTDKSKLKRKWPKRSFR